MLRKQPLMIPVFLCVRWDVTVRTEAARVYQQSNSAAKRDPETH